MPSNRDVDHGLAASADCRGTRWTLRDIIAEPLKVAAILAVLGASDRDGRLCAAISANEIRRKILAARFPDYSNNAVHTSRKMLFPMSGSSVMRGLQTDKA
jgi:hypothetical protein